MVSSFQGISRKVHFIFMEKKTPSVKAIKAYGTKEQRCAGYSAGKLIYPISRWGLNEFFYLERTERKTASVTGEGLALRFILPPPTLCTHKREFPRSWNRSVTLPPNAPTLSDYSIHILTEY